LVNIKINKWIPKRPVPHSSKYQQYTAITRNYEHRHIEHNMLTAYLLVRLILFLSRRFRRRTDEYLDT